MVCLEGLATLGLFVLLIAPGSSTRDEDDSGEGEPGEWDVHWADSRWTPHHQDSKSTLHFDKNTDVTEESKWRELRKELYGLEGDFIFLSMDVSKVERDSGGNKAQLTFTADYQFLGKIASDRDYKCLNDNFDKLKEHQKKNPNSLLPRFLSAFVHNGKKYFLMLSWFRASVEGAYNRRYDLKGTTCSNTPGDRLVRVELGEEKIGTLKDLNFAQNEQKIYVPKADKDELIKNVESDTQFLRSLNLMDYSLILQVTILGSSSDTLKKLLAHKGHQYPKLYEAHFQRHGSGYLVGVNETTGLAYVYSMGLIDIFEEWTWEVGSTYNKHLAGAIKHGRCHGNERQDTVEPKAYQERFQNYVMGLISFDGIQDPCEVGDLCG